MHWRGDGGAMLSWDTYVLMSECYGVSILQDVAHQPTRWLFRHHTEISSCSIDKMRSQLVHLYPLVYFFCAGAAMA